MANLDLVNWTMREARQLSPEYHVLGENDGSSPLNNILLGVLQGERAEPTSENIRVVNVQTVQSTVGSPTAGPPVDVPESPKPETTADLATYALATAASVPAEIKASPMLAAPMSPLLKAIVDPDIYTAPAHRDRAIGLRWVLRDIKGNRLKLSPPDQHDLQELVDMGLVEMRNGAPVLTNAGVDAIV